MKSSLKLDLLCLLVLSFSALNIKSNAGWHFNEAWPSKVSGPSVKSDSDSSVVSESIYISSHYDTSEVEIAIEQLHLAHEAFEKLNIALYDLSYTYSKELEDALGAVGITLELPDVDVERVIVRGWDPLNKKAIVVQELERAKEELEDVEDEIQFQIEMGTSDLQNAENERADAEKKSEEHWESLVEKWKG